MNEGAGFSGPLAARRYERLWRDCRNPLLWTLQGWLVMFFTASGYAKLSEPIANLSLLMRWPGMVSENMVWLAGTAEMALALGVLAPLVSWALGRVMMWSIRGLGLITMTALGFHLLHRDFGLAGVNLLLLFMEIAVLKGRSGKWGEVG